jgi:hypothetical protein
MSKQWRLLNESGELMRTLSRDEMDALVLSGKVYEVRGGYKLFPPPSTSQASQTGITRADMEAVAGARRITPIHRERLVGLLLMKE